MPPRRPFAALALLVLAILACGLPGQSVPETPSLDPLQPGSTELPEPPRPASLSRAVAIGVASGEWSAAEGLARALAVLGGELSQQAAFGDQPIVWMEGTQVVRNAQLYLANPGNSEQRPEITRLLRVLLPSRETLDRFAEPSTLASNASHLARRARDLRAQEAVDCQTLWRGGFDVDEGTEATCLRFREINVGGVSHRIYYPSWWDEGGGAPERALLRPALEALQISLETFNAYGPEPIVGTDIVFTDLPLMVNGVERVGVLAAADDVIRMSRCHVAVFPSGTYLGLHPEGSGGFGEFQQTIAHEIFHCYQMTNLGLGPRTLTPGDPLAADPSEWWVEGSAEYYGSVVYPEVNAEFQYLDELDSYSTDSSLILYSYAAYAFFEYLDAQAGMTPEGIIGILRVLPTEGSLDDQQAAVAGLPGMADTFHAFGQAYLDRRLTDLSGSRMPVSPREGTTWVFPAGSSRQEHADVFPLVLQRYQMSFQDNARYTLVQETDGVARVTARAAGAPGAWGELPPRLNTACDGSEFVVLMTSVVPPGESEAAVSLSASGEVVTEDQPCDECVLGTWTLDNASYLAHMGAEWPIIQGMLPLFGLDTGGATVTPTEVFGVMQMKFTDDGGVSGSQEGWGIEGIVTTSDGTLSARIAYNGAGEGTWRIQEDDTGDLRYIVWENTSFSLIGQMTLDRLPPMAPQNTGGSNDSAFLGTPQRFVCQADTLTFGPEDPQGPLLFHRSSEISP